MQKIMLTLFVTSLLVGCSTLGVYKVDIPQGTPLTQAQASKIQAGMSFQQVRFLLGSPTISDPMNPLRWDYVYNYTPKRLFLHAYIKAAIREGKAEGNRRRQQAIRKTIRHYLL